MRATTKRYFTPTTVQARHPSVRCYLETTASQGRCSTSWPMPELRAVGWRGVDLLYPLDPHQGVVAQRRSSHGTLHQPVEEQAPPPGAPAVAPEGELFEMGLHVLWRYRSLVGACQPPFELRCDPVDGGEKLVRLVPGAANAVLLAGVAELLGAVVAAPVVGDDDRPHLDAGSDEWVEMNR